MLAAGGVWGTGRGESHFLVAPGFPLGPGCNSGEVKILIVITSHKCNNTFFINTVMVVVIVVCLPIHLLYF